MQVSSSFPTKSEPTLLSPAGPRRDPAAFPGRGFPEWRRAPVWVGALVPLRAEGGSRCRPRETEPRVPRAPAVPHRREAMRTGAAAWPLIAVWGGPTLLALIAAFASRAVGSPVAIGGLIALARASFTSSGVGWGSGLASRPPLVGQLDPGGSYGQPTAPGNCTPAAARPTGTARTESRPRTDSRNRSPPACESARSSRAPARGDLRGNARAGLLPAVCRQPLASARESADGGVFDHALQAASPP